MAVSRDVFRRWFGGVCLFLSAMMVILGQTVLRSCLQGVNFIFYWLGCFALTGLTLIIALLDMRAVRKRSRREQSDLVRNALRGISEDEQKRGDKTV